MIGLIITLYIACALICLGWHLAKASSPFIEKDWAYWVVAFICMVFSPIWFMMLLGYKLHGEV